MAPIAGSHPAGEGSCCHVNKVAPACTRAITPAESRTIPRVLGGTRRSFSLGGLGESLVTPCTGGSLSISLSG